jgi:molybdate transport system regulatory protein
LRCNTADIVLRHPGVLRDNCSEGTNERPTLTHFANITEGLRFRIVLGPGVAIGPGKADLLQAIDETASLTAAAARFGMSYKRSWSLVRELNAAFAEPLVETEKGGPGGGGGARLTPRGKYVLKRFRKMEADATKAIAAGVADLRQHLAAKSTSRRKG